MRLGEAKRHRQRQCKLRKIGGLKVWLTGRSFGNSAIARRRGKRERETKRAKGTEREKTESARGNRENTGPCSVYGTQRDRETETDGKIQRENRERETKRQRGREKGSRQESRER